jgi:hypothetical protein
MFFSLQKITALLIAYRYAIIFPIAVIEGPAVSIIVGSLSQAGYLIFLYIFSLFLVTWLEIRSIMLLESLGVYILYVNEIIYSKLIPKKLLE